MGWRHQVNGSLLLPLPRHPSQTDTTTADLHKTGQEDENTIQLQAAALDLRGVLRDMDGVRARSRQGQQPGPLRGARHSAAAEATPKQCKGEVPCVVVWTLCCPQTAFTARALHTSICPLPRLCCRAHPAYLALIPFPCLQKWPPPLDAAKRGPEQHLSQQLSSTWPGGYFSYVLLPKHRAPGRRSLTRLCSEPLYALPPWACRCFCQEAQHTALVHT